MTDAPLAARLVRQRSGDAGTFGVLSIGGKIFATGELPDRGNARGLSCIPAGTYVCRWTYSPTKFFRNTYEVTNVPGRDGVRIHVANWVGDKTKGLKCEVDGCIALGLGHGVLSGQEAVTGSSAAIGNFEALLAGRDFQLTIIDEYLETGQPAPAALA